MQNNSVNKEYNDENIFKMKKVIEWILNCYVKLTGLQIHFLNNKAERVFSPPNSLRNESAFCRLIQSSSEGREECYRSFYDNSLRSAEYGNSYIFRCRFGIIAWVTPALINGELLGSFISEGILMRKPAPYFVKEVIKRTKSLRIEEFKLRKVLKTVKIVSEKKVKSAADVLYIAANYLSNTDLLSSKIRQEKYIQQARISEEIQAIKREELELLEEEEEEENSFIYISSIYPLKTERELLRRVKLGDKEGAKEVLNEILGKILFKNAGRTEIVRARILELAVVLSRAAVEGGAELEMILGLNFEYIQKLGEIKSIEKLCVWIVEVLDRFTGCVYENKNVKNTNIIRKAKEFIRANYKKKIKLEDISKEVYLSPYYLSHIFKKETKSTLFQYLTKVRIEEAKRLLETTQYSTTRISFEVGCTDQSYFSKVFRKIEGISPYKYRKRIIK
jgi:two-component system response regulator YesN